MIDPNENIVLILFSRRPMVAHAHPQKTQKAVEVIRITLAVFKWQMKASMKTAQVSLQRE